MSKHTQGKLHVGMRPGPMVYGQNGEQVADCRGLDESGHNAVRMVACWNACEGLSTAFLMRTKILTDHGAIAKAERVTALAQNLLSKAKDLLNRLDGMDCLPIDDEEYASAHEGLSDAIARVQHGKL